MRRRLPGMIPPVPVGLLRPKAAMDPVAAEVDHEALVDILAHRLGIRKAVLGGALSDCGLALAPAPGFAPPPVVTPAGS